MRQGTKTMHADTDVPKHIKKKPSSVSRSREKSAHRHAYGPCIVIDESGSPHSARYCTQCGKLSDVQFMETEKCEDGTWRALDDKEVMALHKGEPQFLVKDIFQKYVTLPLNG